MKISFPIHLNKIQMVPEFIANRFEEIISNRLNIDKDSGRIHLQHIYFNYESNSYDCIYRFIDDNGKMLIKYDNVSFEEFNGDAKRISMTVEDFQKFIDKIEVPKKDEEMEFYKLCVETIYNIEIK
nr:MAG TPA: hypothetical protein [Caudoviricetes sp.]